MNINLSERVNMKMVHQLWQMGFNDFEEVCQYTNRNSQEHQRDYQKFQKTLKEFIGHNGGITRSYKFCGNKKYGRRYSPGLQGLKKVFRGALCAGYSTDIDIVNCHPSILEYICLTYSVDCPFLIKYNRNRDMYLDKLMMDEKFSRESAKNAFLTSTNTQFHQKKIQTQFYINYDNEMKEIQKVLLKIDDFKQMKEDAKQVNKGGSFINLVMCKYENEILENIIEYLNKNKYEIQALMFDGVMIYGDHYSNHSLLVAIEEHLSEIWGFQFKLDYKQHMTDIEPEENVVELMTYDKMKNDFEKTHLKVGKFYLKEEIDGRVEVLTRKELLDSFEHLQCVDCKFGFIKKWVEDSTIRIYEKMDVYPNPQLCPENTYNLWVPFACESGVYEDKPEAVELFKRQLGYLCDHDEEVLKFVLIWLAHIIQFPEKKSVMLVFIGKQGNAKTWLVLLLQKMFGKHKVFVTSEPSRDVWGHFNPLMKDAFIVNLNEISKKEFKDSDGKFKQLVTEPVFTWHDKGKSPIEMDSHHRFIGTTNDEESIPTQEGDRRIEVIRTSDEMIIEHNDSPEVEKSKKAFFKSLYDMLEDNDSVMTIYNFLKTQKDIPPVITKEMMPLTKFQEQMQKDNRDSIDLFFENMAFCETEDFKVGVDELWNRFQAFCADSGIKCDFLNKVKFGSRITRRKIGGVGESDVRKVAGRPQKFRAIIIENLRKHYKVKTCML